MARISGVDLPRDKRVEIALTYIFGVGLSRAQQAIAETGVDPDTRVRDLSDEDVTKLRAYVEDNYQVEGDLRRWEAMNIKRLPTRLKTRLFRRVVRTTRLDYPRPY